MIKKNYSLLFILLLLSLGALFYIDFVKVKPVVRVGILHSLTGTMATSEKALVDTTLLAIEEINAKGGVLGHQIEAIIADGQSDNQIFAQQAERLIVEEKVSALFGCWTSSCRKAVKKVVEQHKHLLFYPLQYEGLEQSEHIVYTGLSPSQQIIPATSWALENLGKRFYLLGSDYIFPRAANMIIKDFLSFQQGEVIQERYLPLGSHDVAAIIEEIKTLKPDVIINTINGDSNLAFFKAFIDAGLSAEKTPVLSLSLAEVELSHMPDVPIGHYAAWSYFQTIDSSRNREFIKNFKQRFGLERVINDPMEASYLSVYLWTQAVDSAKSFTVEKVNQYVIRQSLQAPQGIISVDGDSRHLWRTLKIGKIRADKQFDIIWESQRVIRPQPFPFWYSQKEWLERIEGLQK